MKYDYSYSHQLLWFRLFSIAFIWTQVNSNSQEDERVSLKISNTTEIIGTKCVITGENGRLYYSFRGIPYVEPLTGGNRWKEPTLLHLTKPKYDATNFGNVCVQGLKGLGVFGDENCLFLNVYTPEDPAGSGIEKSLLPVLVYIHGGGFQAGASDVIEPKLLLKHDVILVTFNYRLGVFGYLSTGNKFLPGNYGALDQVTVLDWVQKYIHHFGGNPKSVTIFGNSAGGAAANILTMSPRAKGKYHKAIIQSGVAISSWVTHSNPDKYILDFAGRLNCPQEVSNPDLINCLKKKTSEELLNAQWDSLDVGNFPMIWNHVVDSESRGDDAFLPEYPEVILDKGLYHSTPIMIGLTPEEGLVMYGLLQLAVGNKFQDNARFKEEIIPKIVYRILPYGYSKEIPRISKEILEYYFAKDELNSEMEKINRVNQIYGDSLFNSGHWNTLQKYSKHNINKVYSYMFTHRTPKSPTILWRLIKEFRKMGIHHPLFNSGITHCDDMCYIVGCKQLPSDPDFEMSPEDVKFAHYMTGIWVAFAKNGNPAEGIADGFPEWKPIESGNVNFYNLSSTPSQMGNQFRQKESEFWIRIYKSLDKNEGRITDEL